jgi:hypothetical protein
MILPSACWCPIRKLDSILFGNVIESKTYMLAISAKDMTMEKNPMNVHTYPQNRPASPPFIIPPVFATSTVSQVPCTMEVNMIIVDCLNMRCVKVNCPSLESNLNNTDLELLVFPHTGHVIHVRIARGSNADTVGLLERSMIEFLRIPTVG